MKKWIKNLTRKRIILCITGIASLLGFAILVIISGHLAVEQDTQAMAKRWSATNDVSQVSCFFSQGQDVSLYQLQLFEHNLDTALVEASIESASENANARLWASAYSATGSVTIEGTKTSVNVNAVGVGGDFFLFHPLQLVSGNFFSGSDLMQDYIVIDEETAWQLFGSNDVAGQMVSISNVPHIIKGVISRQEDKLHKEAGLSTSVAYVSYESLSTYGRANQIGHYEIIMPNPVSGYALGYVKEHIGIDENNVEIVENSRRYNVISLLKIIGGFGTRSMNGKAIIYPYWENVARGYEDILAFLLISEILFLLYPTVLLLIVLVLAWKHKTWTARSVASFLKDKGERFMDKRRAHHRRQTTLDSVPNDKRKIALLKKLFIGKKNEEADYDELD